MPLRVHKGNSISFQEPLSNEKIINVPQIKQEQSNWCWAACAEMVLSYYDAPATQQCKFANKILGKTECCLEPVSPDCNKPCRKEDISKLYSSNYISSKFVGNVVSFSKLQSEIEADRPVEVAHFWGDNGKTGHLVIIRGWCVDGKEEFVYINDPGDSPGEDRIITYYELLTPYGQGNWTWTWVEIRR